MFVGGGTPSLLDDELLARLLAALPACDELTVECNPETITTAKAQVLVEGGVTRVSLGAQSFQPHMLATLERRASPERVGEAVATLRAAGVENLNLDLMFGVPGQSAADLSADLDQASSLGPDHISSYELEAKPGTRFTHRHGAELERQAEALEDHYETVVATLRERRLPLVRDGELLPRRPPGAPQPGLLGGARLPRASASAPSPRSASSGAATGRPCAPTWRRWRRRRLPPRSSC